MWPPGARERLLELLRQLRYRDAIEELLGRAYDLRGTEARDGVEYSAPELGGWIRIRYRADVAISVLFVPLDQAIPR